MPIIKKRRPAPRDERPIVVDDFIYDDPEDTAAQPDDPRDTAANSGRSASDTPDEAIRKLRSRRRPATAPEQPPEEPPAPSPEASSAPKVYSSGVILDEDLQPVDVKGRKPRREHRVLRGVLLTGITLALLLTVAAYIFHRISPSTPGLGAPESLISRIVTPVQSFFSGISESVAGYFRSLKLRANIEAEYNALRAENEQLVYQAMLADEMKRTLSQYEDLLDEIRANEAMRPIVSTVIGKSDSNYFATFTINKGTDDGVENYMAVTISGALVGYTENVQAHSATVRTIIDSNASIAALIQSSRDQGTVRGTLGVDGRPMCRMYYLPSENLPRSGDLVITSGVGMSFPKGIPIGIIRESTRGMEDNKQYIVLEPQVDFAHLEYVIVLRYKPEPEAIEGREDGQSGTELVPLESARPSPVIPDVAGSLFVTTPTPDPNASPDPDATPDPNTTPDPDATPDPNATQNPDTTPNTTQDPDATPGPALTPDPSSSPAPSEVPSPTPSPEPIQYDPPREYQIVQPRSDDPTPSPTPTWAPTSTPYITPDPDTMSWDE